MPRHLQYFSLFITLFALDSSAPAQQSGSDKPRYAGPTTAGFLLPNGWTISPAGRQVVLRDLPLNIIALPDNRHALVATSGFNLHELSLVDLADAKVTGFQTVLQSWFGLAVQHHRQQPVTDIWWSGGGGDLIHEYRLEGTKLTRTSSAEVAREVTRRVNGQRPSGFKSGMAFLRRDSDKGGHTLLSLDIEAGTISAIATKEGKITEASKTGKLGGRPYDVVPGPDGKKLYVSDWAGKQIFVVDAAALTILGRIAVGEHPNQMALHPKDPRLFVACASTNNVSVIDTAKDEVIETISTALFPKSPEGSTPDALAISPDGQTLYVANADNNCVAVIDVAEPRKSQVKGFVPTGWYPVSVAVTPDGKNLLVGVGKGNQTKANPIPKTEANEPVKEKLRRRPFPYIGTTLSGALSIVPVPDDKQLAEHTAVVYRNCPYSDALLAVAPHPEKTAIPNKVGDPSPIKHVIYIIKENRTYDQVFGALPQGNGDPSLVMFGRDVTPNHHKLAEEYVLLDNLYCNGQVSRDGHPWSTMAYNTDYIARDWHLTYSRRKGVPDDREGHLERAPSGYIWDACKRAGVTYRSYGEYGRRVSQPDGTFIMDARVPGLVGHMCPDYGVANGRNQEVRDGDRADVFLKEFAEFEAKGTLPQMMILSLPEDHTSGTRAGSYTPQACVASNDLALGRIVEAVSKSKSWPKIAFFVIEDDAQNGPDHVDAHRTVGLVISPYTKRKVVDSTQYSTVSMIRTMELILGLPPLSQYDAAARPMFNSFTDKPDLTPYVHEPARIDLNAKNTALAYGADRSAKMDFSEVDQIDDFELNEILWRAIKGADAPIPPAVRRAIAFRSQTPSR